jgi:hypothetical protein
MIYDLVKSFDGNLRGLWMWISISTRLKMPSAKRL